MNNLCFCRLNYTVLLLPHICAKNIMINHIVIGGYYCKI